MYRLSRLCRLPRLTKERVALILIACAIVTALVNGDAQRLIAPNG